MNVNVSLCFSNLGALPVERQILNQTPTLNFQLFFFLDTWKVLVIFFMRFLPAIVIADLGQLTNEYIT